MFQQVNQEIQHNLKALEISKIVFVLVVKKLKVIDFKKVINYILTLLTKLFKSYSRVKSGFHVFNLNLSTVTLLLSTHDLCWLKE